LRATNFQKENWEERKGKYLVHEGDVSASSLCVHYRLSRCGCGAVHCGEHNAWDVGYGVPVVIHAYEETISYSLIWLVYITDVHAWGERRNRERGVALP
jgi:hypothetical protein